MGKIWFNVSSWKVCRNGTLSSKNLLVIFHCSWLMWFIGIIMRPYTVCLDMMQWCALVKKIFKSLLPLMVQNCLTNSFTPVFWRRNLLNRHNFLFYINVQVIKFFFMLQNMAWCFAWSDLVFYILLITICATWCSI